MNDGIVQNTIITGANRQPGVDISTRSSRKYELSPPLSFDITQVTRANVTHTLVEIYTPASRFAPVTIAGFMSF